MPFAVVNGEPVTELPRDLYIPPQALEVFLEAFEGPLDLLLYLIRRQNLDILDIPIAEITRQYMQLHRADAGPAARARGRVSGDGGDARRDQIAHAAAARRQTTAEASKRIRAPSSCAACRNTSASSAPPRTSIALPRLERDVWDASAELKDRKVVRLLPQIDAAGDAGGLQGSGGAGGDVRAPPRAARAAVGARAHERIFSPHSQQTRFVEFTQLFRAEEGRMGVTVTFIAILELVREGLIEIVQAEPFAPLHVRGATRRARSAVRLVEDSPADEAQLMNEHI